MNNIIDITKPLLIPISTNSEIHAHVTKYGDTIPTLICERCKCERMAIQASSFWDGKSELQISMAEFEPCKCNREKGETI